MTDCNMEHMELLSCRRRKVMADFTDGDIFSDSGEVHPKLTEKRIGLCWWLGSYRTATSRERCVTR